MLFCQRAAAFLSLFCNISLLIPVRQFIVWSRMFAGHDFVLHDNFFMHSVPFFHGRFTMVPLSICQLTTLEELYLDENQVFHFRFASPFENAPVTHHPFRFPPAEV